MSQINVSTPEPREVVDSSGDRSAAVRTDGESVSRERVGDGLASGRVPHLHSIPTPTGHDHPAAKVRGITIGYLV